MLARTYRLTDKTGVVFIKTCVLVLDWLLDGLLFVERRFLRPILRPFVRGIMLLFGLVAAVIVGLMGGARKATQTSATTTRTAMARRTESTMAST